MNRVYLSRGVVDICVQNEEVQCATKKEVARDTKTKERESHELALIKFTINSNVQL